MPKCVGSISALLFALLSPSLFADATADFGQALDYFKGHRFEEAMRGFEAFLNNHPQDGMVPMAVYYLAQVEPRSGKALAYYERVLSDYPESAVAYLALFRVGLGRLASGNYSKAAEVFTEFLRKYPQGELSQKARYWLAISCLCRGDRISAIGELKEVVQMSPTTLYGLLATRDLERLEKGLKPSPATEGLPETSPQGRYLVQVGSFADFQAASRLRKALEEKGYPVSFSETPRKGLPFYRVRVGPYLTKEEARRVGERLAGEEALPCWIVKKKP